MPPTEWQGAGQAAAAGLASPQVSNYPAGDDATVLRNLYASVGLAVNAWETAKPSDTTKAEQIRSKAWSDLVVVNNAYKVGAAIDLSALTNDLSTAKAQ